MVHFNSVKLHVTVLLSMWEDETLQLWITIFQKKPMHTAFKRLEPHMRNCSNNMVWETVPDFQIIWMTLIQKIFIVLWCLIMCHAYLYHCIYLQCLMRVMTLELILACIVYEQNNIFSKKNFNNLLHDIVVRSNFSWCLQLGSRHGGHPSHLVHRPAPNHAHPALRGRQSAHLHGQRGQHRILDGAAVPGV